MKKLTIDELKKQQAEAKEIVKNTRKEITRLEREAKRKAEQEAKEKEQAEALEFYHKYKDFMVWMQGEKAWHFERSDGTKEYVTRYEFCRRQMEGK